MEKTEVKITPVTLSKATLSAFIDLLSVIAIMLGVYFALGKPVFIDNGAYPTAFAARTTYLRNTELVEEAGDGTFKIYSYKDEEGVAKEDYCYKRYIDIVWHYFAVTVPSSSDYSSCIEITSTRSGNKLRAYESEVSSLTPEYGKYLYVNYFGYLEDSEENYFVPSIEGDFTSKPKAGVDEDANHNLLASAMFNTVGNSAIGYYVDAVNHLTAQPKLLEYSSVLSIQTYLSTLPSILIAPISLLFLLPLFMKRGQTLGKLAVGSYVIDADGYPVKKVKLAFRQAIIATIFLLAAMPLQNLAYPAVVIVGLLGYVSRVMSKSSQALHDKIAHTLVVDKKSIIYASKEERERLLVHETPMEEEGEKPSLSSASLSQFEKEESILDLSTINRRREEARNMTSFDEFEKESDAKIEEKAAEPEDSSTLTDEEQEDLMRLAELEGASPEEAKKLLEEEAEDVDDDGFVDETTKK